jgi:hypothetical protein
MREDRFVGEPLAKVARVLDTEEVCWPGPYVKQALTELASANRVILGFDILDFATEPPTDWDTSGYEMGFDLVDLSWEECVKVSLEKALAWAERTMDPRFKPPFDDVWYCVTAVSPEDARSMGLHIKADS